MADKLIDIGLILFFGGFGFVCYINGVCRIGKDYMQRNKIDLVRWMFSPKHILRSNTPFDSNEPLELKFKEPKKECGAFFVYQSYFVFFNSNSFSR